MHRNIAIPCLLLLLCSCAHDKNYLVTSLREGPDAQDGVSRPAMRYTSHATTATTTELIPVRIAGPFEPDDRAKILRAVAEWNRALNGFVRFDILPDRAPAVAGKSQTTPWMIVAVEDHPGRPASGLATALARTYGDPDGGGMITVYVDRLGRSDLSGVVMHELGHALGLGHDGSGLMAAHYHSSAHQCVDKSTVKALAAKRGLPLDQLNWCGRD